MKSILAASSRILLFALLTFLLCTNVVPASATHEALDTKNTNLFSDASVAQPSNAAIPVTSGFVVIGPAAFHPEGNIPFCLQENRLRNCNAEYGTFIAPVNVPNGATITKMTIYYQGHNDILVTLKQLPFTGFVANEMVKFYPTDTNYQNEPRAVEVTNIGYPLVDLTNNSYAVEVWQSSYGTYLGGIRIDYTYPLNLPLVTK